jgi:VWFA-related protein
MRPMRVPVPFCLLLLATPAVLEGRAQQDGQRRPALRVGIEIVEVPVTVLDRKREPVRGLRAEDFTILEDGKPRPVVTLAAVEASTQSPTPVVNSAAAPAPVAGAAPVPGSPSPTGDDGRLVVMILDRSIPFGTPSQIARMVARSVVQSMAPNDLGAVIYTGSSQRSQDVTGDHGLLLAAIGGEIFSTDSPGVRFHDEITRDRIEAELWHDDAVPRIIPDLDYSGECMCGLCVLETITHIAKALESVPRRTKSIVFIGVELNMESRQVQCTSKIRDARRLLFQALDTSGLIVHAIDASGLETRLISASMTVQGRDLTQPISPAPGSLSVVDRARQKHLERQGNLAVLPDRTGGRFVVHTNDPHSLVASMLRESSSYYVLGFQPAGAPDGKTHQIQVKVNRGSVDVHTRRTYIRELSGAN